MIQIVTNTGNSHQFWRIKTNCVTDAGCPDYVGLSP